MVIGRGNRYTSDIKAATVQAYKDGTPLKEISARYGLHATSVRDWVTEAGVKKRIKYITEDEKNWIMMAFEAGDSLSVIAKRYKVSARSARRIVTDSGHFVKRHFHTPITLRKVIEEYKSGVPVRFIKKRNGISTGRIYAHLAANGITRQRYKRGPHAR